MVMAMCLCKLCLRERSCKVMCSTKFLLHVYLLFTFASQLIF